MRPHSTGWVSACAFVSWVRRLPDLNTTPTGEILQHRPTRSEMAALVNQARLDRHLSVRGAAQVSGVPASTMQGWLQGGHFPTPALRPKFLALVEYLELNHFLHAGLWLD